ncbi:hypothetical protein GCM10009785_01170 [Brooklawnia cerclae]
MLQPIQPGDLTLDIDEVLANNAREVGAVKDAGDLRERQPQFPQRTDLVNPFDICLVVETVATSRTVGGSE